jgi:CRISPR-associated endonuclease/helicase Cas3
LRDFLERIREKKSLFAYAWDHLDEEWKKVDPKHIRPGLTILLPAEAGGYSVLGWDGSATNPVEPVPAAQDIFEEGTASDPESSGPPLTIAEHTTNVCRELELALKVLDELIEEWSASLTKAARWHDAGKAHDVFQASLRRANPSLLRDKLWAKSGVSIRLRHERKYFRHELASALAALQNHLPFEVAYLIAAHHGKVRLAIRSLPGEESPDGPDTLFALGVRSGDKLPAVDLGGEMCPETELDLSPMRLGGEPSWTAGVLNLRDKVGPFRLAYLEALLRAADLRASANERKGAIHG